jgi:ferredoxin-NADP reductase/MOSC domain-containing protein YiiM
MSASLRVLAVSRSQPATHTIHGQPTRTAIVRAPSAAPLSLSVDGGIEGHQSAIHDAQVYAFFAHHYDYWTSRLGVARDAWTWAFWGENLTMGSAANLDETKIHLGDRWLFEHNGQQGAILEVCGGRNPCSRLAWRCGQPSSWLAEVAASGFCGVYLRVVQGGRLAPGDTATIIPTAHDDAVPAATIAQCAYSPLQHAATRAMAERILRVPGLQHMNRAVIARKLELIHEKEAAKRGRWAGWRTLEIVNIVDESASVKSFYFAATDDKPLASYLPGQFLTIKLPSGQIRCWSISSWSRVTPPSTYRITVKRRLSASLYLHSRCAVGHRVLARSPSGSFVPDWNREFPPRQIYISAGLGLTPILSMLHAHFSHDTLTRTPAILIHVARNSEEHVPLFTHDVPSSALLSLVTFYTAPIAGVDTQGNDFDYAGRPTSEFFTQLLAPTYKIDPLQITPIELPGNASAAYICGPPAFVDTIRGYLERANLPSHAIRSETFALDASMQVDIDADADEHVPEQSLVKFRRRAKEVQWTKAEGLSILQLAEREGLKPESGCRIGDCGTCEMKLLNGEACVSRYAGKEAQEASGKTGVVIRTCCSVPASVIVELDF